MRLLFCPVGLALATATKDSCIELCVRDGPQICTGGSWTTDDGYCLAYFFVGHPTDNRYCYHSPATAHTCPGSGVRLTPNDADRLRPRPPPGPPVSVRVRAVRDAAARRAIAEKRSRSEPAVHWLWNFGGFAKEHDDLE